MRDSAFYIGARQPRFINLTAARIASEATACNLQEIATYVANSYQMWLPAGGTLLVAAAQGMLMLCTGRGSWTPTP